MFIGMWTIWLYCDEKDSHIGVWGCHKVQKYSLMIHLPNDFIWMEFFFRLDWLYRALLSHRLQQLILGTGQLYLIIAGAGTPWRRLGCCRCSSRCFFSCWGQNKNWNKNWWSSDKILFCLASIREKEPDVSTPDLVFTKLAEKGSFSEKLFPLISMTSHFALQISYRSPPDLG